MRNPSPYKRIKDLPALNDAFLQAYLVILDRIGKEVQDAIGLDEQDVTKALQGKPYEKNYLPQVHKAYQDLKDKAGQENNISHILGYKDKSASQSQYYLALFDRKDEEEARRQAEAARKAQDEAGKSGQPEAAPPQPAKKFCTIRARELDPRSTVVIRSQADIDDYVERLRQKLEAALADVDEIRLLD